MGQPPRNPITPAEQSTAGVQKLLVMCVLGEAFACAQVAVLQPATQPWAPRRLDEEGNQTATAYLDATKECSILAILDLKPAVVLRGLLRATATIFHAFAQGSAISLGYFAVANSY